MVFGDPVELGHCRPGFLYAAFAVGIARGLWEEKDSYAKDERPDETDAHWYAPRARIEASLGTKVDGVRGEDSRSDEKLIGTDERSAHLAWSSFACVHGDHD